MEMYIRLGFAALLPVILSGGLYLADKKTAFGKLPYAVRQIIFGILFGALAVYGTEAGVPINGAMMNCRDAAVLTAGLMFGSPAGLIAGFIGGIERWFAVKWGVGAFTQVACSVSTAFAGIYAALLRKFMFENKKPGWFISLAIGVVMEIFHLTMVFLTNMATPIEAMAAVRACTVPMVVSNAVSVMLSALFIALLSRERVFKRLEKVHISQEIQRWLLITVVLAFLVTSVFVFALQDRLAVSQTDTLLELALNETEDDIRDESDRNLLSLARLVKKEIESQSILTTGRSLGELATQFGLTEINIVNRNGMIINSTVEDYIGVFNMKSGEQSAEFMCLIEDQTEFVQEYGPITNDPTVQRKYAGVSMEKGFLQVGYDAEMFQRDIDEHIVGITKNRHVGKTGYIVILNAEGEIVSAPSGMEEQILLNDMTAVNDPGENVTGQLTVGGEEVYCRYRKAEGYIVVSVLPAAEAMQLRNIALYVNTFMEILVFAVLFLMIFFLIKNSVVKQIKTINESLARITGGDLGVVVNVRSSEEFASLSDDINSTVETLKHYIDEASARIDKELEFAKEIQSSALPNVFPAFPKRRDFDIHACMTPAKEVGGDFYDFYLTGENRLHFLVADVSGKGIPAAMFMMRAKTELKTLTEAGVSADEVFTHGNNALCEGNDAGMFVTAWQGGIDLKTGHLRFVNAGHNPPLIRRGDGTFEYLRTRPGFVLAGMEGVKYKDNETDLCPGDTVFLYTDGVTEATNGALELFGEERLRDALNEKGFASMKEICDHVKARVDEFVGDAPQFDDITMVAFRWYGKPPVPSVSYEKAKTSDIPAVTEFVEGELEKLDCPMKAVTQLSIAVDEIYGNIAQYAYPDTDGGSVTVEVEACDEPHGVAVRFIDGGIPYNPLAKEDPDVTLSAEEREIGGLGIFMVKKTMDEVLYERRDDKNIFTVKKYF